MTEETLARRERLRGSTRLDELFSRGKIGKTRFVLVRALENGLPYSRIAAIAGKAAGKAHVRGRLRRRLRAAFRKQKTTVPTGWDFVLLARRGLLEAEYPAVETAVQDAISRALKAETPS